LFGDDGGVSASDWVAAAWDAAENQKGRASSILNAMMGSCVVMQTPSFAWELLNAYDALSDDDAFLVDTPITPDIVTLCLAYTALKDRRTPVVNDHNDSTTTTTNGDYWDRAAETILDRAQRMAKKVGGSQRRKALAAAKRKPKRTKNGNKNDDEDDDTIDVPKESELEVLAETADLVVLSKPAGMVCFHKRLTTAGKGKKGKKGGGSDLSLEHVLASCGCALSTLNADARGLVHRLDRGTSGCIVLAKSEPSHAFLVTDFFLRRNSKSYLALIPTSVHDDDDGASFVPKELQEGDSGTIELPVEGRPAKSLYRVERRYDSCFGKPMTLIRVTTVTGRKHQVRIHLAKGLGRPIFMDPLYGDHRTNSFTDEELSERLPKDGKQRFFLHAASLELPRSGIRVEAPLPSWWTKAMN
jgi:23S rRNA-/tRNA-specific pseudouridylate synthase